MQKQWGDEAWAEYLYWQSENKNYVKKINAISEKYSYQQINKNGDTALCYTGTESHVEFIFNVPNRQADAEYNFKFLIKTPDLTIEEEEE